MIIMADETECTLKILNDIINSQYVFMEFEAVCIYCILLLLSNMPFYELEMYYTQEFRGMRCLACLPFFIK